MKLLLVSDLHLTGRTPVSRKDNFPDTQFGKMVEIQSIAQKNEAIVLQAGDFFDSFNPSYGLVRRYIDLLATGDINCCKWSVILGQHDMYMWNLDSVERTPLAVMESAGAVRIIRGEDRCYSHENVMLYGCSWGQEIPEPDKEYDGCNVLVIHRNIGDKVLFPGHELINPKRFLKKHEGWDLVLCGDYHFPFEAKFGNALIINTGVISRKSITEKDIEPSVVLYDTDTGGHEWVKLARRDDVFIERGKVTGKTFDDSNMLEFMSGIQSADASEISFKANVLKVMERDDISKDVKELAVDVLNHVEENR